MQRVPLLKNIDPCPQLHGAQQPQAPGSRWSITRFSFQIITKLNFLTLRMGQPKTPPFTFAIKDKVESWC
jgi:hypothetical protein